MRHLPSIEALTSADDRRLLAELEICDVLDRLARVRELVDRADLLLADALASAPDGPRTDARRLATVILATLRKAALT